MRHGIPHELSYDVRNKRVRVPRKIPPEIKGPVRSFAVAIGELLWASSQTHAAFANVFSVLVAKENLNIGFSIWHVVQSDNIQRQMLAALVDAKFSENSKMYTSLIWAKKKADDLAEMRNDAAHMATAFRTDSVPFKLEASPIGNAPNRVTRLAKKPDLKRQFRTAKSDLVQLSGYVNALFFLLAFPDGQYPWPKRPDLKAFPKTLPMKKRRKLGVQSSK